MWDILEKQPGPRSGAVLCYCDLRLKCMNHDSSVFHIQFLVLTVLRWEELELRGGRKAEDNPPQAAKFPVMA